MLLTSEEMTAEGRTDCVETLAMVGDKYVCCGWPAVAIVKHVGRDEGPYAMCLSHAAHNVGNRGAVVVKWFGSDEDRSLWLQSGRKLPEGSDGRT